MSSEKDKGKKPLADKVENDHEDSDEEASGTSNFSLEFLGRYLANKLKIHSDDTPKEKILEEFTIDGIVSHINKSNCKNIIIMAGAGISTYDKGMLLRHYTQNIDTLERVAGVPDEKLVEAHGTFNQGHCLTCRKAYSQDWMKDQIFSNHIPPICEVCPGVVKPDIVFFGENLPEKFHKSITTDFSKCELLIIMGSSLTVQPAPDSCPRLLINREKAGHHSGLSLFGYGGGFEFDHDRNTRDVCWLGDCDDGCLALADKLGWGDELKELCKKEHERIDKEEAETRMIKKEETTKRLPNCN
ncbi:histone deacetylase sir2 family member [Holotrichia oblita]|uniref:Histone deacetylase sir2 family member n=1 Tax=Holotrichia oblita TaxID=644536 RepID=A0ACB9TQM1_HOLOL|nr:histone deacetylase sir2 family member [Holotrichia oblita]